MDQAVLVALRATRATAGEGAWPQPAETGRGSGLAGTVTATCPAFLVDVTLVTCHLEKEQAAAPASAASATTRCGAS
jgi:hypothetical protein